MSDTLPLLLRAARGEAVERPPVWMMRQAGRYMKIYRDLRDKYPSFRERSENPDLSYEISMQPFNAFKPDGNKLVNCSRKVNAKKLMRPKQKLRN